MAFTANFFIYLIFAFGGFLRFGTNKPTGNLIKFYDSEHDVDGALEPVRVRDELLLGGHHARDAQGAAGQAGGLGRSARDRGDAGEI